MLASIYYSTATSSLDSGTHEQLYSAQRSMTEKHDEGGSFSLIGSSFSSTTSNLKRRRSFSPVELVMDNEDAKRDIPTAQTSARALHVEKSNPVEVDKPCKVKKFTWLNTKKNSDHINAALTEVLGEITGTDPSVDSQMLTEKRAQFLAALFGSERKSLLPPFFTREHILQLLEPECLAFLNDYYWALRTLKARKDSS